MKFSTANWSVAILSILAFTTIGLYFYMRDVHTLPSLFEISFNWIISFTLIPFCIILLASMFAGVEKVKMLAEVENKEMPALVENEYTIKKKHFKKSILITSGLFAWKLAISYFS